MADQPASPADIGDDPAAELRRYRWMAGGCLAVAAGGWAVSHTGLLPPEGAAGLRAVAEAGMIGGLADWFAVTALFRRPLGLPIPHTALVPRNRDRIADGIAAYIDKEFLEPGMLVEQIRRMDPASRLGRLLADPAARDKLTDLVVGLLPGLLRADQEAAIRQTLITAVSDGMARADLRPVLAQGLRSLMRSETVEPLIAELADRLIDFVHTRRGWLQEVVTGRSRWWMPSAVDKTLANTMADALLGHLYDLRTPNSPAGQDLRRWLEALPDEVEQGGPLAERLLAATRRLLGPESLGPLVTEALDGLRRAALADMGRPDGRIRDLVSGAIGSAAGQLDDPTLRERINHSVELAFQGSIPRWREAIRGFITGTLKAQDVDQFTDKLEQRVGRDLQFIRINGTILGAAIGGLLFVLNGFLSG